MFTETRLKLETIPDVRELKYTLGKSIKEVPLKGRVNARKNTNKHSLLASFLRSRFYWQIKNRDSKSKMIKLLLEKASMKFP